MAMKVYSFGKVPAIVGGYAPSGYAGEDNCISVAMEEAAWTLQTGADGESCADRNLNKSGRITFRMQYSSDANAVFSGMYQVMLANNTPVPILIPDLQGATLVSTPCAMIEKMPDLSFGKKSGTVEWVFLCSDIEAFAGGNFSQGLGT